jgi:putative ABC transport system ATP-binding protein
MRSEGECRTAPGASTNAGSGRNSKQTNVGGIAAKTTLLSLLGGLDVPSSGQILFQGTPTTKIGLECHRRDNVAFVFQNYNLIDYLTAEENVQLTARQEPMPVLTQLGLTPDESRRNVLKLSGGQQQRVAIARVLASSAPVILADEPTGNLDDETAAEITAILRNAAREHGRCVVVVSHSNEVANQADVIVSLSDRRALPLV